MDMHTFFVQVPCGSLLVCDILCLKGIPSQPVVLSFAAETGRLDWVITTSRCHMFHSSLFKGMILVAGCNMAPLNAFLVDSNHSGSCCDLLT